MLPYSNELQAEVKKVVNAGGKTFVELGSWMGISTKLIASMLPHGIKLYAINTWKGSQDNPGQISESKKLSYEYYQSHNIIKRLAHKIHPIRMTTDETAKIFNQTIDFLFISAAHNYSAVFNDIMNWYPKLSMNGVICGDDLNNLIVENAVLDAAFALNISVNLVPNTGHFWKMDRSMNYQSSLPEPFKSTELQSFDSGGSLPYPKELQAEVKKVVNAGGKTFVELGSWMGISTRLIASMLPYGVKLYAVDTWKGSVDEAFQTTHPKIKKLFEVFLSNSIIKRVAHKIYPIRMTTAEAAKIFNQTIDFLFVDAAHNYKAVFTDIMNWYPKLSKNGVICGDDLNIHTVEKAALDAAAVLNTSVVLVPNTGRFWKMDRNTNYQSSLPEPFKSTELQPYDDSGSLPYPNELESEVRNVLMSGGRIFVELGSWMGKSTRVIASTIPYGFKLYAVDTWEDSQEKERQTDHPNMTKIFEVFLSNSIIKRVAHKIHPIRMTTDEAAKVFDQTIDFLFIDADNSYKSVYNDITNWYPKLSRKGLICGDDLNVLTVKNAVFDAAAALNISVGLVPDRVGFWKMRK